MSSRFSHTSNLTKVIIIVLFVLVGFLVYSLTKNIYNGYQVDKYISDFEQDNSKLEQENKQLTEDYLYFASEEYIDKIAKQNFGYVNPGEEVIIISSDVLDDDSIEIDEDFGDYATYEGKSNPQKWWDFFFDN